jgi:hypothetical protein
LAELKPPRQLVPFNGERVVALTAAGGCQGQGDWLMISKDELATGRKSKSDFIQGPVMFRRPQRRIDVKTGDPSHLICPICREHSLPDLS